ncbi:MAG: hypothetical protein ABIQ86_12950 [Steroidobacteraceae bacterium]
MSKKSPALRGASTTDEQLQQIREAGKLLDSASHQLRVLLSTFAQDDCSARLETPDILRSVIAIQDTLSAVTEPLFVNGTGPAWTFASRQLGRVYGAFGAICLTRHALATNSDIEGRDSAGNPVTSSPVVDTLELVQEKIDTVLAAVNRFTSSPKAAKLKLVHLLQAVQS